MKLNFNPFTSKFDWVVNKASEISITDVGGYYTGTELETALQEIGAEFATLDGIYLQISNNLSDVANAGIARTNLGLVAGGAGDIWVEKAGDTMTGQLFIDGGADEIQQIIQGVVGQTANLTEWQDSSDAILAKITPTGSALFSDKVMFTQTDGNEYIDSLNDGYMDYGATTQHRFNAPIKINSTTDAQLQIYNNASDICYFYVDADGVLFVKPTSRAMWLGDGTNGNNKFAFWADTSTYTLEHIDNDSALRLSANDATNYTQFAADGIMTMAGTARVLKSKTYTFNYATVRANGKPTQVSRGVFKGFSLPVYSNDDEELFTCQCIPPDWDGSSDPVVYIVGWLDTANTDKNFNLQVSVEYFDPVSHDVVPVTTNDYPVETDTGTAAQYASFAVAFTLDASTIGVSEKQPLGIRVRRIAATSDEITGEFVVEGMVIYYTADKLGEAT